LGWFWYRRNHDREGWDWLATFRSGGDADDALASTALTVAGTLAVRLGQHAEAVALQRTALERCRRRDDRLGMARAMRGLGDALAGIGDLPQADAALTESVAIFRELGATWDEAVALHWFGIVAYAQADYPTATTRFQRAQALYAQNGDVAFANWMQGNVAWVALITGDRARARSAYAASLEAAWAKGDVWWVAWCLMGIGGLAAAQGTYTQAAQLYGVADGLRAAAGAPLRPSVQAKYDELVAACRAALGSAAWEEAYGSGPMVPLADAVAEARAVLASEPSSTSVAPGARAAAAYRLTSRERDVLRLLVLGRSDREIAERLFVSHRTVQDHVSHLLAKLGVANRTEASGLAIRERLI
jgi:DNA-binding CsgD family transcriptional regulator